MYELGIYGFLYLLAMGKPCCLIGLAEISLSFYF